jgi:hypothetical protein
LDRQKLSFNRDRTSASWFKNVSSSQKVNNLYDGASQRPARPVTPVTESNSIVWRTDRAIADVPTCRIRVTLNIRFRTIVLIWSIS